MFLEFKKFVITMSVFVIMPISFDAKSNACGSISINQPGDQYTYHLISPLNTVMKEHPKGESKYLFTPGVTKVVFAKIPTALVNRKPSILSDFSQVYTNLARQSVSKDKPITGSRINRKKAKKIDELFMGIRTQEYVVNIQSNINTNLDPKNVEAHYKSSSRNNSFFDCDGLTSDTEIPKTIEKFDMQLSLELEERLAQLAYQISVEDRDQYRDFIYYFPLTRPLTKSVAEYSKAVSNDGVRLLAVTPGSEAYNIGLRTSDLLTHYNGKKINTSEFKSLQNLIEEANRYDVITLGIVRDKKKVKLSHQFLPNFFAPSLITMKGNEENKQIATAPFERQQFMADYDTLLKDIVESFKSSNLPLGIYKFQNEAKKKNSFGILGSVLEEGGLRIDSINAQSLLFASGLRAGDIITSYDSIESHKISLASIKQYLLNLKEGDEIRFKISRNNEVHLLKGIHKEQTIPGYSFEIDYAALIKAEENSARFAQSKIRAKRRAEIDPYKAFYRPDEKR